MDKLEGHTLSISEVQYSNRGKYYCCIKDSNNSREATNIEGCQVFTLRVKGMFNLYVAKKIDKVTFTLNQVHSFQFTQESANQQIFCVKLIYFLISVLVQLSELKLLHKVK
jgi:hypothetical protein